MNSHSHSHSHSQEPVAARKTGKLVFQMLLGGLSGGLAMAGIIAALGRYKALLREPGGLEAMAVAMVFALMAMFILLGVLAPKVGAKTLNVEDADEIAEQRRDLLIGVVTFALVAVMLAALALADRAGIDGLLTTSQSVLLAGGSGLALAGLSIRYRKRGDEMLRKISLEAGNWALGLTMLLFGGWAALAHLGIAPPFAPLQFIAGLFALYLLAVFIAAGRRGMLKTR